MQPVGAMAAATERYQKARITWRRDHAPDLWSIRIRPEQKLLFKPGQYATIGVERDGRVIERPYSIVSSPAEDEIEFFFELVPGGGLTPLLYNLPAGEALWMRRQAKGLFTLDAKSGHTHHYLVSTVTGVAPYVSMARTLAQEAEAGKPVSQELVMLQAASRSWDSEERKRCRDRPMVARVRAGAMMLYRYDHPACHRIRQ